jgi:hypothetical protein
MKTLIVAAVGVIALFGRAEAGCSAWGWVGGRYICIQSQTAQCVEWGQVGGVWRCIRSQ